MLPSIGIVLSVEMIRDGGSLAAIFQEIDGNQYWLFLKVRINELPAGVRERVGYEMPVVVDRLTGIEIPVTWKQAQVILSQIGHLLHHDRDRKWFGIMQETVLSEGTLPNGVNRHFDAKQSGPI
jgi:hypothetical protein